MGRQDQVAVLACPETRQRLEPVALAEALARMGEASLMARARTHGPAVGATPTLRLRDDRRCAYPVAGEVPVLLVPGQLRSSSAILARRATVLGR